MKRIFAAILLLILFFPSIGVSVERKDLVWRNGLYYQKFSNVPFTGNITAGREQGWLRNGKKEGLWLSYWSNGQLHAKIYYKAGKRHGLYLNYRMSGVLRGKGTYKNGRREGRWVYLDRYGNYDPEFSGTYRNGSKIE
tara:strand:- start:73 stop:486 length:414 start_codon:yes stop_codon:yes gene_type:complete